MFYPTTNTKSMFYRPNEGTVRGIFLYSEREFIYEQTVTGQSYSLLEVMDAYTGTITKSIQINWSSPSDIPYEKVGSLIFNIGSGTEGARVQAFETEIRDNDKITIPFPEVSLGAKKSKVSTGVKIPYPTVYKGEGIPANELIPLLESDSFELPEFDHNINEVEVTYTLQKGNYEL